MARFGGPRKKTRYKLQKHSSEHGRVRITAHMQTFNEGDSVALTPDSSVQRGMYHPRFIGMTGVVTGMQGKSYRVKISNKGKTKTLLVLPVHLRKHV